MEALIYFVQNMGMTPIVSPRFALMASDDERRKSSAK
jgi:hypothetical protein